ncbi:hypothetical protein PHJA_002312500 [Phtheirospermum japonicum]|uniref:Uncharacterized protein n=1 Tax=Phtheirospermum japonicum TaxID=374723 RepID=A0A830D3B9_9LAMI|nr:hypothetical protein PHJA_002312500 [Phtheirospermum japonicum]
MTIPVRFRRVAAAFDKFSRISDGSEDASSADLSDLVNSFLEREIREQRNGDDRDEDRSNNLLDDDDDDREMESNSESRELLNILFGGENDAVRRRIHSEVEKACREINGRSKTSSPDFKRRLVSRLRSRGFDAGLCKSKCEKKDRRPFGDYEYVEVNAAGDRYIIEVYLAGEFTIARPTGGYAALLENFPPIFVGKPDELRQVVRLMCSAIRNSMKSVGIIVPPWRRLGYMQSKWFGSYKRTTNETVSRKGLDVGVDSSGNRRIEFVPVKGISFYCRDEFASSGAALREVERATSKSSKSGSASTASLSQASSSLIPSPANASPDSESSPLGQCDHQSSFPSRTETYALLKQQLELVAKFGDYNDAARIRDSLKLFEDEEPVLPSEIV